MESTIEAPMLGQGQADRLAALEELEILGTAPEQEFDDLTELAAFICGTPVSLISLVGDDHQFFKSARNFDLRETPIDQSFCTHAMSRGETLVVPDAHCDPRFANNPLVLGDPNIRFYAGSPISSGGQMVGALCVIDKEPRHLSDYQQKALASLARQASSLLTARLQATRNRRLREQAETSREMLAKALDAARLAAWFYDPGSNTVGGDELMGKFFGLNTLEGPAELWLASIVDEDRTRVGEEFAASLAGAQYETKYRVMVHGAVRWLHAKADVRPLSNGTFRMVGVCEDVSREEALSAELEKTKDRLAIAQEASGAVSFDWSATEDKLVWNKDFVLGRPASEFATASDYLAQMHEDDRHILREAIHLALHEGRGYYIEFRLFWPDGSTHWISSSSKPFHNAQGEIDSILGVNLDITERKLSEEALLHSEKLAAVGRLASVISHEINNPLEAVTNLLYIVRMGSNLTQQDRDNLEMADRELARVGQITAQTLRFHRNLNRPGRIDASTLVHEMLTLYRTRLTASQIEVRLDLDKSVAFTAFEGDIRQVLNNLIGNAFDAMRNGGMLTIRTRCSTDFKTGKEGASILVVDSGPGISEKGKTHIFEAFYSTKGINGAGLGLWIAKRIVHKHKGHLQFRSRSGKYHGTAFRMWLPVQVALSADEAWA